jgi:hypothetical protein
MRTYTIPVLFVAALCGACGGKAAPNTGADPAQQGAASRDRAVITQEELMAPGGMGAQSLLTAIKTLRPTFLTNRGMQSYNNCKNNTSGGTDCAADPDAGAVHVSVDNGRILPVDELNSIHTATVKEVRYFTAAQAMQKFGGAARSGPVILVTMIK